MHLFVLSVLLLIPSAPVAAFLFPAPMHGKKQYSSTIMYGTASPKLPSWIDQKQVSDWVACGELADGAYFYDIGAKKPEKDRLYNVNEDDLKKYLLTSKEVKWVTSIYTNIPAKYEPDRVEPVFAGFVAQKEDLCFICWRGTRLPSEWRADADNDLEPWAKTPSEDCTIHRGFKSLYESAGVSNGAKLSEFLKELKGKVDKGELKRIFVTGHSLGGALATLCCYETAKYFGTGLGEHIINLVTFSGPRVASVEFAEDIDNVVQNYMRIVTDGDLVPALPLYSGNFVHAHPVSSTIKEFSMALHDLIDEKFGKKVDNIVDLAGLLANRAFTLSTKLLNNDVEAMYHHAGTGLIVSGAAVTFGERYKWDVGTHHNLKLILYLLDGSKNHLDAFEEEMKDEKKIK